MRAYKLDHLSDPELLHALTALVARERITTAELLAHVAEVDARKLYAPAGYPSMFAYCVEELRLSEEAARKRIHAARTARRFPAIFAAVAEGRLHLSAVIMLAPYLVQENAAGLLAAAAGSTKSEVEHLLAERFPRTESLGLVTALPGEEGPCLQPAGAQEDGGAAGGDDPTGQRAPGRVEAAAGRAGISGNECAPGRVPASPMPKLGPIAPGRFVLQVTIGRDTHEKLCHAQALLSHKLPTGALASVLDLALDALVEKLEKRKFAKTDTPRPRRRRTSVGTRHIPAHVKRAVWARDRGRCTFVGDNGHRCNARKFLEYDHVNPVARGGEASVDSVRLRCRVHNQLEAERVFGAGFMNGKRAAGRGSAAPRHAALGRASVGHAAGRDQRGGTAVTCAAAPAPARATLPAESGAAEDHAQDVMACLRTLGVRADQARRATAYSATTPAATLEARVRAALQFLGPRPCRPM